ncbi:hypothetical protein FACS1894142_8590 [Spirochaetia bacterium]|nr:hypothetical protein FACS1894142_8590 [Spirochaetia bacterium]
MNLQEMIVPALTIYAVTMLSTAWKGIAVNIVSFIKRKFSTTIYISNNNWTYYTLMDLFDTTGAVKKPRHIRFQNGRWGENNYISIGLGVGFHVVRYKRKLLFIAIHEKENHYNDESLGAAITLFGNDMAFVDELRNDLYKARSYSSKKADETALFVMRENVWTKAAVSGKRKPESVFMPHKNKEKLFRALDDFIRRKDWYKEKNIPHQLGILLYGPPGTGKTSIIKAIAAYLDRNICFLRASELDKLQDAVIDLPSDAILVIEDIDSNNLVLDREAANNEQKILVQSQGAGSRSPDTKTPLNLSDVLNIFDGLLASPDRILIMTTNHIEKLDPALIRPGRTDIKLEIGPITPETFSDFIRYFYDYRITSPFVLKDDTLTISALQNDFLTNHLSLEQMLEKYTSGLSGNMHKSDEKEYSGEELALKRA